MKQLPKKPSALLRLAVKDAKRIQRTPGYRLEMGTWHSPSSTLIGVDGKRLCEVCLAGSVMVCSLGVDESRYVDPHSFDPEVRDKLFTINDMRTGRMMSRILDFGFYNRPQADLNSLMIGIEKVGNFIERHLNYNTRRAPWWVYLKAADRLRRLGV